MKILLLANNITWSSELKKKVENVKKFFAPLGSFEFTIENTSFKDFPLSEYTDSNGGTYKSVDENWYDNNVSIPARNRGFDIVVLLLTKKDWVPFNVQGYGSPNDCGIEEIVMLANKTGKYTFNGVKYSGDQLTHILQHELLHRIYSSRGIEDNTHKHYLAKTPEKCLDELTFKPTTLAILIRQKQGEKQTLGDLIGVRNGNFFLCKTLELPYRNNENDTSSIPTGTYSCDWTYSPRFKKYMYIVNVASRPGIRIHGGNVFTDTEGCILVGDAYKDINADGLSDLINSKITLDKLESFFDRKSFILTIN